MPAYAVEAHTVCDIQQAFRFARQHNIQVRVKSSGHTEIGSSTGRNSLLIWLAHYPTDGEIIQNFADTCGTRFDAVVGIAGGEGFGTIFDKVKDQYHLVSGSQDSLAAAGGWLQGGGLSATSSRFYGLGIDQVAALDVVLTDGRLVRADACMNSDLFWALLGGGGGTYGVIVRAMYKLHPKQSVVRLGWSLEGDDYLRESGQQEKLYGFTKLFLEFWIEQSPNLDKRWSGTWGGCNVRLSFLGPEEDARSTFVDAFDDWYDNVLIPNTTFLSSNDWGAPRPSSRLWSRRSLQAYHFHDTFHRLEDHNESSKIETVT